MKNRQSLLQNLVAALTVSFVALSLGAAFGILSGRGVFVGMISAALFASITSLFGGTRVQCSGPTGPMTAVMAVLVAFAFSDLSEKVVGVNPNHFVNLTIIISGIFLIIFGILRLGKYIKLIPNVVVSGFMNGIAIIIWGDQIKKIFGLGGKTAFTGSLMENVFLATLSAILVFGIPLFTKKFLPKFASVLSATFITIIFVTGISVLLHFNVERVHLEVSINSLADFKNIIVDNIPRRISWELIKISLPFALQLAILAYLDTLMTSLVVDKMTKETTKQNQELAAQGLASLVVAFFGGVPGAQATIRSVLIIKEKATMRLTGVLVGVFALIEMLLFQDAINLIPQAVFAGVLIKVGYDVFDWLPVKIYFKNLIKRPVFLFERFFSRHDEENVFVTNREVLIILGTTLITVFYDLNTAVALFTIIFYLHNKMVFRGNPMRDLKPALETESFDDEN